jgi:hypothetical protein
LSLSDQSQRWTSFNIFAPTKAYQSIVDRDYIPHVRGRGEGIEAKKLFPATGHADGS